MSTDALTMLITQSGETADTIAALREAQSKGLEDRSASATSSDRWSRAKRMARSTRTPGRKSAWLPPRRSRRSLRRCSLFALYLAEVRGAITPEEAKSYITELSRMPGKTRNAAGARRRD